MTTDPKPAGALRCVVFGLISGILLSVAFSGASMLAWVGFVPVFVLVLNPKTNFAKVYLALSVMIIVFYTFIMRWLGTQFHPIAIPGIEFGLLVIHLMLLIGLRWMLRIAPRPVRLLAVPLCFTLFEFLRTVGFVKYPYGILAYSQAHFLPFIQIADITGYLGVSFLLYLINALIAGFWLRRGSFMEACRSFREPKTIFLSSFGLAVAVALATTLYGSLRMAALNAKALSSEGRTIRTSLIQPWYDYNQRATFQQRQKLLAKLERQTSLALEEEPSLVIWPESAVLTYYKYRMERALNPNSRLYYDYFKRTITNSNLLFLVGSLGAGELKKAPSKGPSEGPIRSSRDFKTKGLRSHYIQNAAFLIGEEGNVLDDYAKMFLVPFAEWFPYTNIIPLLDKILESAQASQFQPGERLTLFKHPKGTFFVLICYEDCFSTLAQLATLAGAEFLVVITNDAWSYKEVAATQHHDFSVLRAVENRRTLVRAANAGVTSVVSTTGKTEKTLPLFEEGFLVHDVPLRTGKTLYTRYGDKIVVFPVLVVLLFFVLRNGVLYLKRNLILE